MQTLHKTQQPKLQLKSKSMTADTVKKKNNMEGQVSKQKEDLQLKKLT